MSTALHTEAQRRKRRHGERRRQLRRKLEAQGVPEEEIERRLRAMQADQQRVRDVENHMRRLEARTDDAYVTPDDRGYRPSRVDPVLSGAARATGETAKAVRRGKTITAWQHEERS